MLSCSIGVGQSITRGSTYEPNLSLLSRMYYKVKEMMALEDYEGRTLVAMAATSGGRDVFEVVLTALRGALDKEEVQCFYSTLAGAQGRKCSPSQEQAMIYYKSRGHSA